MNSKKNKIGIIGLGYVGLPLSVAFSKKNLIVGYDVDKRRINDLKLGLDQTGEVSKKEILRLKKINFTSNDYDLSDCNIYIITVPTPVDNNKKPNLNYLLKATKTVSKFLKKNDLVIYESTVFRCYRRSVWTDIGKNSGLKINKNIFLGYSLKE